MRYRKNYLLKGSCRCRQIDSPIKINNVGNKIRINKFTLKIHSPKNHTKIFHISSCGRVLLFLFFSQKLRGQVKKHTLSTPCAHFEQNVILVFSPNASFHSANYTRRCRIVLSWLESAHDTAGKRNINKRAGVYFQ